MTGVYANPDRWAATLNGWGNSRPLHVSLLPDPKGGYYDLAAGWTVTDSEVVGDEFHESAWRAWIVRNMMALDGHDYQASGSARYWRDPAKTQAEIDRVALELPNPPAELHIPLRLVLSARLFTPQPTGPTPQPPEPAASAARFMAGVEGRAEARRRGWRP